MCEKLAAIFGNISGPPQEEKKVTPETALVTETAATEENVWVDDRSFFEKYSPKNIVTEVKKRLVGA
jgi:hypothetical protein